MCYIVDIVALVDETGLESSIQERGRALFAEIRNQPLSFFDSRKYTGKLMEWAMADEAFRVALFRFVDVLPSLDDASDVMRHVREYFEPVASHIPTMARWGLKVDPNSLTAKAMTGMIRGQVQSMARQFIVGSSPANALKPLRKLRGSGFAFTVDLLGEACVSEAEASDYMTRYLNLIRILGESVQGWPESESIITGHRGERTVLNISVKLSALYSQAKAVSHRRSVEILSNRLGHIFKAARAMNGFVYVDMEDTSKTDLILDSVRSILEREEFGNWENCGIVLQAYLRRTENDLQGWIDWARNRGTPIAIRLVKGAYWDTETIQSNLAGWPVPVWQKKVESDACYERCARRMLDAADAIYPAFGSHSLRSLCAAIEYAGAVGVSPLEYELQVLFGMAEPVKRAFARNGFLVREYAPVGELLPGMAYLVRRLLENTSNQGFVRQGFYENESVERLLQKPVALPEENSCGASGRSFRNAPLRDFAVPKNRDEMSRAIKSRYEAVSKGPMTLYPIVDGETCDGVGEMLSSYSPDHKSVTVAKVTSASPELVEEALKRLNAFFPVWRETAPAERCGVLTRAATILESRREALGALMVLECGKPWGEADADVAEAIDFCNFYAENAEKLFVPQSLCDLPGEEDTLFYEPRGVCAVIAPWNFPSAIPCGMFAAALVTGNTVALKPAEQSPAVAEFVFRVFLEAGMPASAAAFLPGPGEEVGRQLVESSLVSTIVFTGSNEVGLKIIGGAAEVAPGQTHVKRVIAEMGGKNAIIVDSDADLDQAVNGVVHSAFGYAGQKCSACSRVLVVEGIFERFIGRLAEAVRSLPVGRSLDPSTVVGPVIDEDAFDRLSRVRREKGEAFAEALIPSSCVEAGWFIPPSVYLVDSPEDSLMRDELFGPILAVLKVADFESALSVAMNSPYGLTGGVFSRSPANLRLAARRFRVGNLYLNRGCTGALVGRQPFGGARMSGVGSKAGGTDYLQQFVIPRCVTENTLRQGFAPMNGDGLPEETR